MILLYLFIQGCSYKNYLQPLNKENLKYLLREWYFAVEKLRPASTKQFSERKSTSELRVGILPQPCQLHLLKRDPSLIADPPLDCE